jgi:amino acid transporter
VLKRRRPTLELTRRISGSASVARGLSLYLDTLINDTLKDTFRDIAPLGDVDFLSKYFDFFAFGVSLILAVALAFGLKESSWVNNIFTLLNLAVVAFVIVAGGMNGKCLMISLSLLLFYMIQPREKIGDSPPTHLIPTTTEGSCLSESRV